MQRRVFSKIGFVGLLSAAFCSSVDFAQEVSKEPAAHSSESQFGLGNNSDPNAGPQFFFDARSTGFSKDGQRLFEGDVIAIGPKSLVTADKVSIDEKKKFLVADGHVIILSNGQYITGDKVELWSDTGDLRVTSALLVINDSKESDRIAQEILGYTASEIEFEAHRQSRLSEVTAKKDTVKQTARSRTKQGLNVTDDLIQEYARYLEQENKMMSQENPAFAQMSEARRRTLRRRRDFWEQARLADKVNTPAERAAYFRLSGETIERTNGNDLLARDGIWTPCHCEGDETPAWALRSSAIEAQPGGYATFNNAILEIKGLPVLYLPWFRVPIKDKRQSGFLPPSSSSDPQSGSVFSIPLYLDLGRDKDVTLKSDFYERRGTKFGFEGRYKKREFSGYQLNLEVMRDRLWMTQKANREDLHDLYNNGLSAARSGSAESFSGPDSLAGYTGREYAERLLRQRSFWESTRSECLSGDPMIAQACEDQMNSQLQAPSNTIRGKIRLRGQERISDRLSMVTTADAYSDRLYDSDLYVPESITAGFDTGAGENALQPTRLQFHNDQTDYYLGLGSQLGDSVRLNDRFEGYQMPAVIKAKSRWFRLGNTGSPIYASTSLDQLRIARSLGKPSDLEAKGHFLPSGWWRRFQINLSAPISSKSAVQIDHFTDLEARHISFNRNESENENKSERQGKISDSSMQTLKTGFRFQLPIDGKQAMPAWLGSTNLSEDEGTRYIQHLMNWSVTLAARPSVVRRGPYGESDDTLVDRSPQRYMLTDRTGSDDNINPEEFMNEYQLVTFATSHRWKIFNEVWRRRDPDLKSESKSSGASMSWEEKARRELLYSMDHPVKRDSEMFSDDQSKWFISRYELLNTDYLEPVSLDATISYDYLKETKRRKEPHTVENRPWSDATGTIGISAFGWALNDASTYNIYEHIATKHALTLTPPGFFKTNVSFGYTLNQNGTAVDENRRITYTPSNEKTVTMVTSLTEPIYTTYVWSQKIDQGVDPLYRQKIGLIYGSKSECWGLGFSREKDYGTSEHDATYLLQFSVLFMGQPRPFEIGSSLNRELKKENASR